MCDGKEEGGMGFKCLHEFNLALLAKQCWKYIRSSNCLMTKVLEEKYFKGGRIIDAKLGDRPSYIWRSMWKALDVIRVGLRCKIGNGRSISVWRDPWLGGEGSPFVGTTTGAGLEEFKVADLLHFGERAWNEGLVNSIFEPRDSVKFFATPLSLRNLEDGWFWYGERDGEYSVKSGYKMLRDHAGRGEGGTRVEELWKKVWSIGAPPKMLHFLWRAISGCLPTLANLWGKGVRIESVICKVCGCEEETGLHLLAECGFASVVWRAAGFGGSGLEVDGIKGWVTKMLEVVHKSEWSKLAALC